MQADQPAAAVEEFGQDEEVYKSDSFRMQCMKVLPCSKRFVHDWTECPFAHPQEKARRRDPRVHNYTGIACPSMKKEGCCAFGDHCPYAHNVFEYWLHPTRYRTQLCNDGSNCKRKICFFAHSLDELRVPACKPFVSPEALASAAASAAADAEAKRKAATIGSPLSAFAALSPGPSPQRSSLDALRAPQLSDVRLSGASVAAPSSPPTSEGEPTSASSPVAGSGVDAGVQQTLQSLAGAGFNSQESQVIELVTSLLAQDKVSAEQAASILQQMLPPEVLSSLQAQLTTPRNSADGVRAASLDAGMGSSAPTAAPYLAEQRSSAPAAFAGTTGPSAFAAANTAAASLMQPAQQPAQQQVLSLEQLAAMQAAQSMGVFPGSVLAPGGSADLAHRMSCESSRSSFDTGALLPHATTQAAQATHPSVAAAGPEAAGACAVGVNRCSSTDSEDSTASGSGSGSARSSANGGTAGQRVRLSDPAVVAAARAELSVRRSRMQQVQQQAFQQQQAQQVQKQAFQQQQAQQAQQVRLSTEAALRRMSAEEAVGSSSQQQAALAAVMQQQQLQQVHAHAVALQAAAALQKQQHRQAVEAVLQQRRQMLLQPEPAISTLPTDPAPRDSEEMPTRMSYDLAQRASSDFTPRGSLEASYPANPAPAGSFPGQHEKAVDLGPATPAPEPGLFRSMSTGCRPRSHSFWPGQLSSVPEAFPMINAPPPTSNNWGGGLAGVRYSLDSATDRLSEDLNRMSFEASARPTPPQMVNPYSSSFFAAAGPPMPSGPAGNLAVAAGAFEGEEQLLGGTALHRLQ